MARRAPGATSSGCSSSTTHLALADDDRDGARPVVGQLERRHEARRRSCEESSGVDQVRVRILVRAEDHHHPGRDEQARPARPPAGGVSSKATRAISVAPRISKRIATDTAVGLMLRSTRFTSVWPRSCAPITMPAIASHVSWS